MEGLEFAKGPVGSEFLFCDDQLKHTPPKTNMDTPHDGLEKVVPFKYGHYWYLC